MNLTDFIAGLPKAELHVHHVGSAGPRIVSELAARHPGVVPTDPERLRSFFEFRDFAHFVEVYLAVVDLIRTPEDVRTVTYEVARDMTGQGLRYAELTCTPHTSVVRGVPIEAYTEAIEDARVAAERDFGLVLRWIYDIPGELGVPGADATLDYALHHAPDALVGFGLGGPEIGVPRPQFQPHFDAARATGSTACPTPGRPPARRRSGTPSGRWVPSASATGSAPPRTRPARTPGRRGHPTGVCPSSNVATRAVERLEDHPLPAIVAAGVPVTINSDDPPMFGTTLVEEYAVAARLLDLDEEGIADLARAAVRASYAPDGVRASLLAEIDDWTASARTD